LEEKPENQHARLDVEEGAQNLKGPHHGPIFWVELGRGYVQVLKKSTLKNSQRKNETQDLK